MTGRETLESLGGRNTPRRNLPNNTYLLKRERREIGRGALSDLLALARGFMQENGGRRISVWGNVDIHEHMVRENALNVNIKNDTTWVQKNAFLVGRTT